MATEITILRVDPVNQHISKLKIRRNIPNMRRVLRATTAGHDHALTLESGPLVVAFNQETPPDAPGFRFSGHSTPYRGICIIAGLDRKAGRLTDTPVDVEWLKLRIRWEQ